MSCAGRESAEPMEYNYPKFTKEMKQTHTILIPNMAILQFRI